MRRSNSRETRRAVEAYVLDQIADINARMEQEDTARPVSAALETLREEMSYQSDYDGNRAILGAGLAEKYHRAGRHGFVAATSPYWVWHLAAKAGEFDVCYYDQRQHLAQWLDETPEEAGRYSDDDVIRLYIHLTAQAFERLYERETTPRRVSTADFARILQERQPESHFFDRETMRFFGQTRRDITVYAFELVTAYDSAVHDCYRVSSRGHIDGFEFAHVHYFDRETLEEITPATTDEEA